MGIAASAGTFALAGLLADVGFVGFHDLAGAAQRLDGCGRHGFTKPMGHEPRGLIGHAQHAA